MASFLQWNIRGLRANREDLSILLADTNPTAVCLQETFLTADKTMKFNNYTTYCMPAVEANGTPHGGVALLIKNGTPHSQISLNTSLQAIALRITLHRAITVCSIYLPPTAKYDNAVIDNFITQLPPPVLLLGDFNAHSHLWGCHKTTIRGKQFEDFLLKHNLSVLNDGSPTYYASCNWFSLSYRSQYYRPIFIPGLFLER